MLALPVRKAVIAMKSDLLKLYFRKLRMLYCSELQLISFLPDLVSRVHGSSLRITLSWAIEQSRQRRNELELLANEHQISVAGNDCQSMRRLIGESRAALDPQAWHYPGDRAVTDVIAALHRLQILNYGVARSLAGSAREPYDTERLDVLLEGMVERFSETCHEPVRPGLLIKPELSIR